MKENCTILLVEDESFDVTLFERAWRKAGVSEAAQFRAVVDGQEAIDYLEGAGRFADRAAFPPPSLLLLDLKLQRRSGFEVFQWLRERQEYRNLPVVIHSSSDMPTDVEHARSLGAAGFWIKAHAFPELQSRVLALIAFARGALTELPGNRL